jgi:hypothetical protein
MNDFDDVLAKETDEPVPQRLRMRVMDAVRRESRRPDPIAFPWSRFAVGLAAGLVLCVLAVIEAPSLASLLRG